MWLSLPRIPFMPVHAMLEGGAALQTSGSEQIKDSTRTEILLDSLVRSLQVLSNSATRLYDAELLPATLQPLAESASSAGAWCCWQDRGTLWFYTAQLAAPETPHPESVGLRIASYNADGSTIETGIWMRTDGWHRLD